MGNRTDLGTSTVKEAKGRQVEAIRCLRHKLQKALKVRLTNEEVADYWFKSAYSSYYNYHLH